MDPVPGVPGYVVDNAFRFSSSSLLSVTLLSQEGKASVYLGLLVGFQFIERMKVTERHKGVSIIWPHPASPACLPLCPCIRRHLLCAPRPLCTLILLPGMPLPTFLKGVSSRPTCFEGASANAASSGCIGRKDFPPGAPSSLCHPAAR